MNTEVNVTFAHAVELYRELEVISVHGYLGVCLRSAIPPTWNSLVILRGAHKCSGDSYISERNRSNYCKSEYVKGRVVGLSMMYRAALARLRQPHVSFRDVYKSFRRAVLFDSLFFFPGGSTTPFCLFLRAGSSNPLYCRSVFQWAIVGDSRDTSDEY